MTFTFIIALLPHASFLKVYNSAEAVLVENMSQLYVLPHQLVYSTMSQLYVLSFSWCVRQQILNEATSLLNLCCCC